MTVSTVAIAAARRTARRTPAWSVAMLVLLVAWSLLPLYWVFKMSVSPNAELIKTPTLTPQTWTLEHYSTVFNDPTFLSAVRNSLVIAGATTVISLVLGTIAAYPLARMRFRFRGVTLTGILALAFFPTIALIAPLYREFKALELLNTYQAVIVVDTVFALPLTVWIMVAFFRKLPTDLEEAARVDGAGVIQTFLRVILPLTLPGLATAGILTFVYTWNEFLFAVTFLFGRDLWPVTVLIPNYAQIRSVDYGAQAAAALLVTIPLAAIVLFFQRRLVEGLTAGALKG
jgi:trehalose/maltose transport system permease protein